MRVSLIERERGRKGGERESGENEVDLGVSKGY